VIVNGLVMAGDGEKMSKSKKNFTDPMDLVEKYGADAFRYSLLSSPVMNGENIPFPDSYVEDSYKKVIAKLENVLSFYELLNTKINFENIENSFTTDKFVLNTWI
jgi:isoleucyl-tRNA synthetase